MRLISNRQLTVDAGIIGPHVEFECDEATGLSLLDRHLAQAPCGRERDRFGNGDGNGLNFVIWAPPFSFNSGGILALHRLAHNLCELGHNAYLWSTSQNREWKGKLIPPMDVRAVVQPIPVTVAKPITIYPELICGNPLSSVYVVRWILNTPGVCGGDGVFGERDLIMLWDEAYQVHPKYEVAGLLTAYRDLSHFCDFGQKRAGTCYAVRKGFAKRRDQHPAEALCIDGYAERGGDEYLIRVFNERELFVCYDDHTMLPTLAALCGCEVVVIPGAETRQAREARGETFAGIAWGFEDRERARATRHLARAAVEAVSRTAEAQTREFVELCQRQWPELRKPVLEMTA